MAKKEKLPDNAVYLCPEELPEGFVDWVVREVINRDDTLIHSKGNVRGICYACGRQVRAMMGQRFRQNERVDCPLCDTRVTCYREYSAAWRADYVANVAAIQRGTDGETVFIRLWHVERDPVARYEHPERWLEEIARYAIRGKLVGKWQLEEKCSFYFGKVERWRNSTWERHEKVTEIYDGEYEIWPDCSALDSTPLQYAALELYWERQTHPNTIRYLVDFARYPVLEYLNKQGFIELLRAKSYGIAREDRGAIRWEGKRLQDCFRFPLRMLGLREPHLWEMRDVHRLNGLWEAHMAGRITEAEVREMFAAGLTIGAIEPALPYAAAHRIVKYLTGQPANAAIDYKDYIGECEQLHLDLTDKRVLFPKDLRAAHRRTAGMVAYEKNKAEIEAFAAENEKLQKLSWTANGLTIRPAQSHEELKAEGAALHHCVAGYASRMAKGETAIFVIRRTDKPYEPYYTLELRGGAVIQCRTKANEGYERNPEVKAFVDAWLAEIVANGGKKKKRKAA